MNSGTYTQIHFSFCCIILLLALKSILSLDQSHVFLETPEPDKFSCFHFCLFSFTLLFLSVCAHGFCGLNATTWSEAAAPVIWWFGAVLAAWEHGKFSVTGGIAC